ncbi:MAG: hypothetical protein LQ341_002161 [Variospora aurantia]|nr:MAG: hypothetical protein LQ341_002161 [Variospora aurantia]
MWDSFNQSLGGKLVATTPIASPCHHGPFGPYDAQQCSELQSAWFYPETHFDTSSSIMAPYFTNSSCNPFLPRNASCTLGNYVSYSINASTRHDVQKTLLFARTNNIRLTIRNTGHDYNGKATGAGAVAIWTHHMKSMRILEYRSPTYTGKSMKMGAGVQANDVYQYASFSGFVIVGSISPTVGIAGGYTQGGGHGPLASKFGMAADQVLEWEVVTASGEHLTATESNHADLYWALSGGGGGTYGVVISLTVKIYPELATSAANLTLSSVGVDQESFWDVVESFQRSLPSIVDASGYASFFLTNESFTISPILGPGVSKVQLQQLLVPTLTKLEKRAIQYSKSLSDHPTLANGNGSISAFHIDEFPTFHDSYRSYNFPVNVSQLQIGGRLIPRSLVQNNISSLLHAQRSILGAGIGAIVTGVCVNVSVADPAVNAVNPVWRTSLYDAVISTPFSYTNNSLSVAYANLLTNRFLPLLEDLTPGGGAYINEADFQQPDFQHVLYGVNYPRLLAIKAKYDPLDMFYALAAVGSERWYEDHSRGGRLCRAL